MVNERSVQSRGTLRLAKDFVDGSRSLEKTLYARWWRNPLRYAVRKLGLHKSRRRALAVIAGELGRRYKGVLLELFRRAHMHHADFPNGIASVWMRVADEAKTMLEPRSFSKAIWDSAHRAVPSPGAPSLKPKVMLRQFVDEMASSDGRGALRTLAYGEPGFPQEGSEALNLLSNAYPFLHEVLLGRLPELDILSDSAFSEDVVGSLTTPYVQYETWLFRS
jgi:hypothetical protein